MGKAEDIALKKYPKKIEWVGNQWDGAPFDVNSEKRFYYQQGYHQAEKDMELGLEDIKLIIDIVDSENLKPHLFDEIDYQEVLKRFKEKKENG